MSKESISTALRWGELRGRKGAQAQRASKLRRWQMHKTERTDRGPEPCLLRVSLALSLFASFALSLLRRSSLPVAAASRCLSLPLAARLERATQADDFPFRAASFCAVSPPPRPWSFSWPIIIDARAHPCPTQPRLGARQSTHLSAAAFLEAYGLAGRPQRCPGE